MVAGLDHVRAQLILLATVVVTACGGMTTDRGARSAADPARADSTARARQDSINRARPDYIVDSILPTADALRRFRAEIGGDAVTRFSGGSLTRAALIERFVNALARADTGELRTMAVTAREFADLYYMDSPYARPPYRQPPTLAWTLIQKPSSASLTRLLRASEGRDLHYVSHTCNRQLVYEGRTTRHPNCLVVMREGSDTSSPQAMFATILEIGGQFKFLSYTTRR